MEVEILSREVMKPSSPTPLHLKMFKRSLMDQVSVDAVTRFICFYPPRPNDSKIDEMVSHLKNSLSETLTRYYPLAGEHKDKLTTYCNDKGALFVTTRISCAMDELINPPKFQQFHKIGTSSKYYDDGDFQVSIQFNKFSCGGIAIFFSFSHMLADATTISSFLKCWGAIARGSPESVVLPEFKSSIIFPPRESIPADFSVMIKRMLNREGKSVRKRFVFRAPAISILKEMASKRGIMEPTSVEVVSSFVWKHAMAAAKVVSGAHRPSLLVQPADMRRRMVPPLPQALAGNIVWLITVDYEAKDSEDVNFEGLMELLRMAKEKNRDEFVPGLQIDGGYKTMYKFLEEFKEKCDKLENLNLYQFVSWCKIGLNEVDFGWGKPFWFSLVGGTEVESMFKNIIMMVDGGADDEIEVWLLLDQREMDVLERDQEFLTFASSNPGIVIPQAI